MNASFSFPKSNTQRKLLNIKNTCVYHTPETRYMPNSSILWHTCVHIHRHVDYSSHHLRLYITLNLSAYVTKSFSVNFYRNNKVTIRVDYLQKCLIISSNWFKWQYILFRSSLGEHQNFSNGRQNATVLIHLQLKLFVVCVCIYVCVCTSYVQHLWLDIINYSSADLQPWWIQIYEGHLESKERFAIKKYLLIIGKKKNMQVILHTFTYFST